MIREQRRVLTYCTCRASKESALDVSPFVRLPGALDLLSYCFMRL